MAISLTLDVQTLAGGSRTNSAVPVPTGVQAGDFIVSALYIENGTATPPTDFVNFTGSPVVEGVSGMTIYAAWKRATGADSGTYTWTHDSYYTAGASYRITGVVASPTSPEDVAPSTNNGNSQTATSSGITTATDGAALVQCISHFKSGAFSGSTLTERADLAGLFVGSDLQANAGPSGNKTADNTGADAWAAILIALRPAAGGGPYSITAGVGSYSISGGEGSLVHEIPLAGWLRYTRPA